MKALSDAQLVARLAPAQRGVFSVADLRTIFSEPHPTAFSRRINALQRAGVIHRFIRGWYVTDGFDLPTLSQRIAPSSYVSFGTVLSRNLLLGARPEGRLMAAKVGRSRTYANLGVEIAHLSIALHLDFGHAPEGGVEYANSEKAVLDTLYFYLHGTRFFFDPFSDIDFSRLDEDRMNAYLARYRNPKFIRFAEGVLRAA